FPPLPEIPEPLRGNSFAVVEAVFLGDQAEGEALLEPLRKLGPALDTFAMVPPAGIAELHMDPRDPMPYAGDHTLTGELDAAAIENLVAAAGPGSGSSLVSVELRHMGGALARAEEGAGAVATMPGQFISHAVGVAADPETTAKTEADLARVMAALAPYESGRYFNFVERTAAAESFFDPATAARLLDAKQTYDPTRLFQANHELGAGR
ncbi:MAG TPA: hypothetical protein VG458_07935, partial [Solirubrobacterales bacterium]|nr:hypothetical protein [Solirubrobacterales bacterium]